MVLEVKDVSKLRDRVPVLKNISFTLEPGIYGLLGANGAGKTTLFHVICGLLDADRGCIKFDHKDVKKDRELFLSTWISSSKFRVLSKFYWNQIHVIYGFTKSYQF